MGTLTPPKSQVPIGSVSVNGQTLDVTLHPEFARYFFDSFRRQGGTAAPTNNELQAKADSIDASLMTPLSDPLAQEAMRAVDELRNELSSVRSNVDELRQLISSQEAEIQSLRRLNDLRRRVEQLEDRLT